MTPAAKRVREYLDAYVELHPSGGEIITGIRAGKKNIALTTTDLETLLAQHAEMVDVLRIIAETAADEFTAVDPEMCNGINRAGVACEKKAMHNGPCGPVT